MRGTRRPHQPRVFDSSPVEQYQFKYICVLDFEATCDEDRSFGPQEIIEFPSVLCQFVKEGDKVVCKQIDEIQFYLKPVHQPQLTPFCTKLTGITQQKVDAGHSFEYAVDEHRKWLERHLNEPVTEKNVLIVTCGDWDLKSMLPAQSRLSPNAQIGSYLKQWCNVKFVFSKFFGTRGGGMASMLKELNLKLVGRHHSGIDDCRNIARVVTALHNKGCPLGPTGKLSTGNAMLNVRFDVNAKPASNFIITEST